MGLFGFFRKKSAPSRQDLKPGYESDVLARCAASAKFLGTDLIEVGDSNVCCEKCAAYRKRIYSLSGKDRRFPTLPDDFHTDCGLFPTPFVEGVMETTFSCRNLVRYSNRPFKDDRTREEKERHDAWVASRNAEIEDEKRKEHNRTEFSWLEEHLPELCPKSLSGYSRMKSSNSKNFQTIVEKAKELGYEIK